VLEKWIALVNEKILPAHKIGSYRSVTSEHFKIKDIGPRLEKLLGRRNMEQSLLPTT